MRDELRTCQNCKQEFTIAASDFLFYKKVQVPPPTWCSECRNMRRLAWRNERVLYTRACDLCKKPTLSIYHLRTPLKVFCRPCWWSDNWDPMEYGQLYDPARPFFEQWGELFRAVPHCALMNAKTENSEYCNETDDVKDSYMAVCTFFGERLLYTYWFGWGNDCIDTSYTLKSNLCYDVQDVFEGYNSKYVYNSTKIVDSQFCFSCHDCTNCFMSVNLRHKSYCIRNKQYTKEEYAQEMKKYDLGSYATIQKLYKEFEEFKKPFPRKPAFLTNAEDCSGDYIQQSKNVRNSFDVFGQENSKYMYDAGGAKDCMDCTQAGIKAELMYEAQSATALYNCRFLNWTHTMVDCEYVDSAYTVESSFGCVGLRKKQYCIFNQQYSKEAYKELRKKIVGHMKKTGEYGEFFPIALSPFSYNETVAHQWYPHTKEEVQGKGWRWQDQLPGKYEPPTITWDQVSDTIAQVDQAITKEILACTQCNKDYRIVKPEFEFYKKHKIPVPRRCPDCRFYDRLKLRNPRKLWHRKCTCGGVQSENGVYKNTASHAHGSSHCPSEFETTYSPERPEIVYCEQCYQAEVV